MLHDVLYVIFFLFTHRQIYATSHFTGASRKANALIAVCGAINTLLEIIYLVYLGIKVSVTHAILLFIVSMIIVFISADRIAKITFKRLQREGYNPTADNKTFFWAIYNYKCDVSVVLFADIGIIVNAAIIVVFFLTW